MEATTKAMSIRAGLYEVGGMQFPENAFPKKSLQKILGPDFRLAAEDVIIASYPRTGTTLACEIVSILCNEGNLATAKALPLPNRVPFMEHRGYGEITSLEQIESASPPRQIKTHLPYHMISHIYESSQMRVVYVMRNPKDAAVSKFHFDISIGVGSSFDSDWHVYFDKFIKSLPQGQRYGYYVDHIIGYWEKRHTLNVHFVKYEDLVRDPARTIKELAGFLGRPRSLNEECISAIVDHVQLEKMRANPMVNSALIPGSSFKDPDSFIRKGKVGDWKNYFNAEESSYIDDLYQKKLVPRGVSFDFE